MTTRTVPTTPRHDGRHCGHVSRSDSPTVKRAAILAECLATVEGFALPEGEPVAVLAVVEAITAGAPCDRLALLSTLAGWEGDASTYADATGDAFLLLPSTPEAARVYGVTDTGLSFLRDAAAALTGVRA